jgi:hypothetical protein
MRQIGIESREDMANDRIRQPSQQGYLTRPILGSRITESEYPDETRTEYQFPAAE